MGLFKSNGYIRTNKAADGTETFASNPGLGGWVSEFAAPVSNFIESATYKPDTSAFQSDINNVKNNTFNNADNIALLSSINNMTQAKTDYDIKDDLGFNVWGELGNDLMQGVGTLASTGNIYAAAGSLVMGLGDTLWKGLNTKKEAERLEKEAKLANKIQQNNALNAVDVVDQQNDLMMKQNVIAAEGGLLNTNNLFTEINTGGTHEQNPFGGVPMGIAEDGSQNLVEEGEVIYKDYVFSNRLKPSAKLKEKYKITDDKASFAKAVKDLIKPYEETMDDPITKKHIESLMQEFTQAQEEIRMKKKVKEDNIFWDGGKWIPMFTNAAAVLHNVANAPDYTYANKIANAAKLPTAIKPTLLTRRYNPTYIDTNYLVNKGKAQAAATRSALLNTAGNAGAARANLLAQDYATQGLLADTYLKGLEANEAKRLQAEQFNLGVDQYNADALYRAAAANAQAEQNYNQMYMQGLAQAAALKSAEDQARAQAMGINLEALADNAYQLYKDNQYAKWVEEYGPEIITGKKGNACGGNLNNKKKRKGLTY